MLRDWTRDLRRRFTDAVDSDEVRLFQAIVYAAVFTAGIYMSVYGAPTVVSGALGPVTHWLWIAFAIIGPVVVGVGDWLVYAGEDQILRRDGPGGGGRVYWGWHLQAGGDIVVMSVFVTYSVAMFSSAWAVRGVFGGFIQTALAICCLVLITRDIRRIIQIERT